MGTARVIGSDNLATNYAYPRLLFTISYNIVQLFYHITKLIIPLL